MNTLSRWLRLSAVVLLGSALLPGMARADEDEFLNSVTRLCEDYVEGFGHANTKLCYHHRLDGPQGVATLSSPQDIAKRIVQGRSMPYGYGSGIQDVALENGQFLFALCDAYEATRDERLADLARRIFQGLQLVATVSQKPGFVPRGPHPNGKSYYPDSSRDQTCAFVEAMWRYGESVLATLDDRAFIADSLRKVGQRMERNGYVLMVEDGSHMAHVGWGWKQHTMIGSATLLGHLAAVRDATGDSHWDELYDRFGDEKESIRWRLISVAGADKWRPDTLYSNQFFTSLAVLTRSESVPARVTLVKEVMVAQARRALHSNVFDVRDWRRLDWAGDWSEAETEKALQPFGLTLKEKTDVVQLYARFDAELFAASDSSQRRVNAKLLMGLPTVAFHKALLSEDPHLVRLVSPHVKDMVAKMLQHGDAYTHGENFNRAVILGLHLVAQGR